MGLRALATAHGEEVGIVNRDAMYWVYVLVGLIVAVLLVVVILRIVGVI